MNAEATVYQLIDQVFTGNSRDAAIADAQASLAGRDEGSVLLSVVAECIADGNWRAVLTYSFCQPSDDNGQPVRSDVRSAMHCS